MINIQETSNILFIHYNYEQYLKKFILLFPNIYQCKVDSIILPNSALCLPHKNKMIRFSFSTLNSKVKKLFFSINQFFPHTTKFI